MYLFLLLINVTIIYTNKNFYFFFFLFFFSPGVIGSYKINLDNDLQNDHTAYTIFINKIKRTNWLVKGKKKK